MRIEQGDPGFPEDRPARNFVQGGDCVEQVSFFELLLQKFPVFLKYMFKRPLRLPSVGEETFFLWGPRQSGKSTLLRSTFPDSVWLDLLRADQFRRYLQNPERLRQELERSPSNMHVVIDEVQKVPALLDEVHWLHENRGVRFALCGSSARKVRRGRANLLGGRALRFELHGLTVAEIGGDFDLDRMLNHGYLPPIYTSSRPQPRLRSYVADYLKEEVAAEGLVRRLPAFSELLGIAALSDTEPVNMSTIARECGVSSHTIKAYFEILEDTLLGRWLPSYRSRAKRKVVRAPKFYFADVGVVNVLARRGVLAAGTPLYGKAFENWVHHELTAASAYAAEPFDLAYWRLSSGVEVDFIVDRMRVAIEAKSSRRIGPDHLKGLRQLVRDHPEVERRIVVCLEPTARLTDDGIEVMPAWEFATLIGRGQLL